MKKKGKKKIKANVLTSKQMVTHVTQYDAARCLCVCVCVMKKEKKSNTVLCPSKSVPHITQYNTAG